MLEMGFSLQISKTASYNLVCSFRCHTKDDTQISSNVKIAILERGNGSTQSAYAGEDNPAWVYDMQVQSREKGNNNQPKTNAVLPAESGVHNTAEV
jgi:hypothetical protein